MSNADRPVPRRRATPAPDEAAGATPIAPRTATLPVAPQASSTAANTKRRKTYAQLNVRLDDAELALFEALQEQDGTNQVDTVRTLIREAAARRGLTNP